MPITKESLHNIIIITLSLLAVFILYSTLQDIELITLAFLLGSLIFILL